MATEEFIARFKKFDAAAKAFKLTDREMGWLLGVTPVMISRYRHGVQAIPKSRAGRLKRAMMIVMLANNTQGSKGERLDWAIRAADRTLTSDTQPKAVESADHL